MRPTSLPLRSLSALTLLACAIALPAHAAGVCAKTGTQLNDAITAAANNGQDDEIRIVKGVIDAGPALVNAVRWEYRASANDVGTALDISGGWDTTCTTQTGVPADTVLDAESKGAAFKFYSALAGGLGGKVSLRNLTITRGRSDYFDGAAVAYDGAASGGGFTLERVAVLASETVSYGHSIVYVNQSASGQVKLLDNVFAQNQVKVSSSSIVVVDCAAVALCSVNNNSIHDNYAYDDKHPFALFLLGTVYAANNAVANNLAGTVYGGVQAGTAGTRTLSLRNNHFENDNFSGEYLEQGTTSGSAKWTLVGAYRTPNPNSPLRNSGVNSPLGGVGSKDIAGQTRIQDGTIDRGAIEVAPTPNSAPQLNVLPQYTVPASVGVGFDLFIAYAFDDGLPQPLTFSFTYNSCPDLVTIAAATGSVRLKAPVPAGLPGCSLEIQAFDGQYGDVATTVLLFDADGGPSDGLFKDGFN